MAEGVPTQAVLVAKSDTEDTNTGVLYIEENVGLDWYPDWAEWAWRIVRAIDPAAALRVYQDASDGELFGVYPGVFLDGTIERSYAGSSGNALTNSTTNYVYLTRDATLTVATNSFPDPSVTPHLRLATIVKGAAGVDFDPETDVVDYREHNMLSIQYGTTGVVLTHDDDVLVYDGNLVYG